MMFFQSAQGFFKGSDSNRSFLSFEAFENIK